MQTWGKGKTGDTDYSARATSTFETTSFRFSTIEGPKFEGRQVESSDLGRGALDQTPLGNLQTLIAGIARAEKTAKSRGSNSRMMEVRPQRCHITITTGPTTKRLDRVFSRIDGKKRG